MSSKTYGIIFDAESVKAILAGMKSETRRLRENPWRVGDLLYIKEAWLNLDDMGHERECRVVYRATEPIKHVRWRSPMFMPKWAARPIRLRVVAKWQEPLQAITEEGARAEGVEGRGAYIERWNLLHPDRPFETNPMVWVTRWEVLE